MPEKTGEEHARVWLCQPERGVWGHRRTFVYV